MKYLLTLFLVICPLIVSAQSIEIISATTDQEVTPATVTLTWSNATQREDGAELPPEEIDTLELYVVVPDGNDQVIVINDTSKTAYVYTPTMEGDYTFAMVTIDTDRVKSGFSEYVSITVEKSSRPGAPLEFKQSGMVCSGSANCILILVR